MLMKWVSSRPSPGTWREASAAILCCKGSDMKIRLHVPLFELSFLPSAPACVLFFGNMTAIHPERSPSSVPIA